MAVGLLAAAGSAAGPSGGRSPAAAELDLAIHQVKVAVAVEQLLRVLRLSRGCEGFDGPLQRNADERDRAARRVLELLAVALRGHLGEVVEPGRDDDQHARVVEARLPHGVAETVLPEERMRCNQKARRKELLKASGAPSRAQSEFATLDTAAQGRRNHPAEVVGPATADDVGKARHAAPVAACQATIGAANWSNGLNPLGRTNRNMSPAKCLRERWLGRQDSQPS